MPRRKIRRIHDSRQRHLHPRGGILQLHLSNQRDDPRQRYLHRIVCVRRLHLPDQRLLFRHTALRIVSLLEHSCYSLLSSPTHRPMAGNPRHPSHCALVAGCHRVRHECRFWSLYALNLLGSRRRRHYRSGHVSGGIRLDPRSHDNYPALQYPGIHRPRRRRPRDPLLPGRRAVDFYE